MKTPPTTWIIGGPAYRMQIDARHALNVTHMAIYLFAKGHQLIGLNYRHGVPVEIPRNEIFERALSSESDFLLTMDSDTFGFDLDRTLRLALTLRSLKVPCFAYPSPLRDGTANIWLSRTEKVTKFKPEPDKLVLRECFAIGTACVVYNLAWYREHWPKGPHFRTEWGRSEFEFVSEDIWHSLKLRDLGSSSYFAATDLLTHAHQGV